MDIHLKQRLTGAVILVLIAVLLVPELLTGPDSPPAPDVAEPGVADAGGMRSYEIDVSDAPRPAAAPLPAPAIVAAPTPVVAPAPPPAPAPAPSSTQAPASVPLAVKRPAPVARAPAPVAEGRLVVQVGSFSARSAADKLASDLRKRKFPAAVSSVKASGRTMYRVRVGPVADRAAANELAGKLRAAGHEGTVVPVS